MLPQVFEGTDDYQVYTVQPFRLPSWAPGHYLATAMFFEANEVAQLHNPNRPFLIWTPSQQ